MEQKSIIKWQTGTPKYAGQYLITTKHHNVEVDRWTSKPDEYGDHWYKHCDIDVIAWCEIVSIEPFKF